MERNDGFIERLDVKGAPGGPFNGLSFGVKDLYDVEGTVTGAGNPEWRARQAPAKEHAAAVATLLGSGARLVGKTITDEFAYSLAGANHHYGAPVNPNAPDRTTGGSSSGSASATAAGLVDIGLGSDTGGSVRLPASYCGLYGIRTTHGRAPMDGLLPLAPSYDAVGWFTRDAGTLARVGAAFGMDALTIRTLPEMIAPFEPWEAADTETSAALLAAMQAIDAPIAPDASLRLTESGLSAWGDAFRIHQGWEIWRTHGRWMEQVQPALGPGVKERFAAAKDITDEAAEEAHELRDIITKRLRDILRGDRVMALPSTPGPAPLAAMDAAGLNDVRRRSLELLCIAGHAGLPQISIPLAKVGGAPVGLGLIGSPGEDGLLLGVAREIEKRLRRV